MLPSRLQRPLHLPPSGTLAALGLWVATVLAGLSLFAFALLPLLLWAITGRSPLAVARQFAASLLLAFGTGSSVAALPAAMQVCGGTLETAGWHGGPWQRCWGWMCVPGFMFVAKCLDPPRRLLKMAAAMRPQSISSCRWAPPSTVSGCFALRCVAWKAARLACGHGRSVAGAGHQRQQ